MSLGSFMNNELNPEEISQLQRKIDEAVLCATVVGQRVLLFLNHYYRHRLENGHPVPEISESLVKVVIDKLVNIKIVGTAHDLSKETFDDLESFFQQHFLPLLEPMKSILKDRPIFDQKGKIIASGNKNPLIYLARNIKAICENHVVTNIYRRVGKLLTALAIPELEACGISRKSYPVRAVIEHLLKTLTEDGGDVCFSLPTWMTDLDWKSKLSEDQRLVAYLAFENSFEKAKLEFIKGVNLSPEEVQKCPAKYFPLLFAIRHHFERENDNWTASLCDKTMEEKKAMAKEDYRGGALVRAFPLLPEFGDGWQPITVCSQTLFEWLGGRKDADDPQRLYRELWAKYFQLQKVIPTDPKRQISDRSFHYMIRTDGVWVGVMVNTLRRRHKKRPWHPKEPKILGVGVSTSSRLLATDPKDLLGKIVAVVDPGKKPIMTVGYYHIASDFDKDGKLKYEPHRLTDDQRGQQHKQQRRWRQRNSRRESGKTNKAKIKRRKKIAKMKRPGVPAQITDDTRQRSEPKPTRRSHGHFMQISTKYWKEITGQGKRQRRLRRWERKSGMNDLFIEAQKYPRLCSATEYTKYIKFTQSTMRQRLTFSGQRRVRRLRLDAHIGRKRAEGELCRRFLQPAGTRVDQMVVLWGDGDFAHNMPGSATSPCKRLRYVLCQGTGGRSGTGVRPAMLPGSEHNTSQRCPNCHGKIDRHIIDGKRVTALSFCKNCSIFCTQRARPMIVERYVCYQL